MKKQNLNGRFHFSLCSVTSRDIYCVWELDTCYIESDIFPHFSLVISVVIKISFTKTPISACALVILLCLFSLCITTVMCDNIQNVLFLSEYLGRYFRVSSTRGLWDLF